VHDDQIDVTASTVRELVDAQFPQWRQDPITRVTSTRPDDDLTSSGDTVNDPHHEIPPYWRD
jgi:hypothetical protein